MVRIYCTVHTHVQWRESAILNRGFSESKWYRLYPFGVHSFMAHFPIPISLFFRNGFGGCVGGAMALSRKWIFFLDKSLGRKELGGIYPKMLQVGHFPEIHGVTCPKNIFYWSYASPPPPHPVAPFSTPLLPPTTECTRVAWPNPPFSAGIKIIKN